MTTRVWQKEEILLTIEASETIRKPDVKLLGNNLFAAGTETDLIGFILLVVIREIIPEIAIMHSLKDQLF